MRIYTILILSFAFMVSSDAQRYFTKKGNITFTSEAIFENIEAFNNNATAVWDWDAAFFEFSVPIKKFNFEKALMQTHFNENYLESEKYPFAYFRGVLIEKQPTEKEREFRIKVQGDLTIHGVTNPIATDAIVQVSDYALKGMANFSIAVADYNIEIPWIVREKVAKIVDIAVEIDCEPLK